MKSYTKAINLFNKKSIGKLFSLNFHYLTYNFKAETEHCLLITFDEDTVTFLMTDRVSTFNLNDKDIVLYAKRV